MPNAVVIHIEQHAEKCIKIFLCMTFVHEQASMLTQNDTGPVGPVTPSIYWSCKMFTGPTFFL